VRQIINDQYAKTRQILAEKKDILDKGARLLLEKEKIDGEEIKMLMEIESS
jgi:cell division protease FtsH